MTCPSVSLATLPEVHFGFPWDQACDILSHVGFPDPREYVTAWIVGDIGKAGMQAGYWDMIGTNLGHVHNNVSHGASLIDRTWEGRSATQQAALVRQWLVALDDQSLGMKVMAGHVRDMVGEALDMAQMVVDTIKFVVSTLAAGWSCAYIPIYGAIKIVEKVKDTWHLINNARKVISVFWSFLNVMKDAIMGAIDVFSATSLPDAPMVL